MFSLSREVTYRLVFPLLLLLVCSILFFAFLNRGDLSGASEGNYAEIPREMVESDQWIIPHLNYVPYLEKPPLFYWLTALTYKVAGPTVFAARFWSAFPALLLTFSVFGFLRKVRESETAMSSALILATSTGMMAMARISYMDMLLCLCTAWAFMSFYLGDTAHGRIQKLWFLMLFVSLALAVLTKGLIGIVLPGLGIFLYILFQKRWRVLLDMPWVLGTLVFLAIAMPWHLLAGSMNEKFYWFYFINEHWLRFLGQRFPKDYYEGPVYYQALRVLLLFLPWSLFLPTLFMRRVRDLFRDPLQCFLLCWFLAFLLFYTVSKAKANYYMMPGLPALAMLVGLSLKDRIWSWAKGRAWTVGVGVFLLFGIAFYAVLVIDPHSILKKAAPGSYPYLLGATFALSAGLLASFLFALRAHWRRSLALLIAAVTLASLPVFAQAQIGERRGSILPLVYYIEANEEPDTMVAMRGLYEKNSQLSFHWGKRFTIVSNQGDVGGDLDFGARFPEHRPYYLQWPQFLKDFGGTQKILYVTEKEADLGELQGNNPGRVYLVARVADRLLISNFPPN